MLIFQNILYNFDSSKYFRIGIIRKKRKIYSCVNTFKPIAHSTKERAISYKLGVN